MRCVLVAVLCAVLMVFGACGDETTPEPTDPTVETPATTNPSPTTDAAGTPDTVEGPDGPTGEPDSVGQAIERGEIKFEPGAIDGVVAGSVNSFDGEAWTFEALSGQTAELDVFSGSNFLQAVVRAPDGSTLLTRSPGDPGEVVVLPASGVYRVAFFLVRAEARRGGRADYSATLTLYVRNVREFG